MKRKKVLDGLVYLKGSEFPTYYSRGAKTRAERLSMIAAHGVNFVREFFPAEIQTSLLVLNEEDWAQRSKVPYGFILGRDNFVWYPVCAEDNPVYQAMMPYYENSPEPLRQTLAELLPDSEAPFLTACVIWWDTYLVHELFGDYINYAYLRRFASRYPTELKVTEVYFALLYQGGRSLVHHTSLEDFEALYMGVG
ncbi:MAG: hypothetical protein ACXACF_07240, partial [Candidatus Hermodarchaeia archaeon]